MKRRIAAACGAAMLALGTSGAQAAPVLWGDNGHYYDFVSAQVTFAQALAAADALSLPGYDGYLATVTSADETAFLVANFGEQDGWFAAADTETEGVWKWMAGPELGQIFFGPGAPGGSYSNWNSGEPNDSGNEDVASLHWSGANWNDLPETYVHVGYYVEYGPAGVPEPAAWALMILGFGAAGASLRQRRVVAA